MNKQIMICMFLLILINSHQSQIYFDFSQNIQKVQTQSVRSRIFFLSLSCKKHNIQILEVNTSMSSSNLETLQTKEFELTETVTKLQADLTILKTRLEAAEKEKESVRKENRELIVLVEKEKKDKNQLFAKISSSNYNHTKEAMDAKKYQNLATSLSEENANLKTTLERLLEEKAQLSKDKQELMNRLSLSQAKAEVATSQEEIILALSKSNLTLESQNKNLKQLLEASSTKEERRPPLQPTVVKNNTDFQDQLIQQCQNKIASKQRANIQLRNNYQKKIAELNYKIATLTANISNP